MDTTENINKAVFLDRDGTIIEDPGYINDPNQVKLLDGAAESLVRIAGQGYKLVVVTNQSASLDGIYYCPYHPEGVIPKYRTQSDLRKPEPGMLKKAAKEMNIDLGRSWMIGDSDRDIRAGVKAGCKTILLDNFGAGTNPKAKDSKPDYRAVNIREAANIIRKYTNTSPAQSPQPQNDGQMVGTAPRVGGSNTDLTPKGHSTDSSRPAMEFSTAKIERQLDQILDRLQERQRNDMFGEFSVMRLIAGIVQSAVFLCVLISIWIAMGPDKGSSALLTSLGFAILFQIMALTFYIMQRRQ